MSQADVAYQITQFGETDRTGAASLVSGEMPFAENTDVLLTSTCLFYARSTKLPYKRAKFL